jgi:HlyD family secretion protein
MTRRGPLAVALAAAVVLAVVVAVTAFLPTGRPAVPTVAAAGGGFVRRVPAEGNLRATVATPLVAPASPGALRLAWIAPEGSRVAAGEVVARFDPTDMEKALVEARDDLAAARLKEDKQRAEAGAEVAKLGVDEKLARGELESARRFQKKDATIYSRSEIIESELDEGLAREKERHAKDARQIRGRLGQADLNLLRIEQGSAQQKIGLAERGLAALTVTAPHAGVLVHQRDWRGEPIRVGDTVWNGQQLAELPDLRRMEAEVFVLEADAGGLAPGKLAAVELESAPGVRYAGRVARVDSLAKPRLRGSPVQYFAVTLELAATDPARMKPGARVRAWLTLDELPRAVTVPRQAVFERDGKSVVYRRRPDGGFDPVPVTLGPAAPGRVVIATGLKAGEVVALRDPTRGPEKKEEGGEGTEGVAGPKGPEGPGGGP